MNRIEKSLAGLVTAAFLVAAGYAEFKKANMTPEQKVTAATEEAAMFERKCAALDENRIGKKDYDGHSGAFRSACMAAYSGVIYLEPNRSGAFKTLEIIQKEPRSEAYSYLHGYFVRTR